MALWERIKNSLVSRPMTRREAPPDEGELKNPLAAAEAADAEFYYARMKYEEANGLDGEWPTREETEKMEKTLLNGTEKADAKTTGRDKLEEPAQIDRLENYFRPGRLVPSYGGTDRVLEFRRQIGGGPWGWEVLVENATGVGKQGPRTHCTVPRERALTEWEKENPIPAEKRRKRVFLDVPFAEKDQVKAAGAKWDQVAKAWYVPPDATPKKFARWMVEAREQRPAFEKDQGKGGEKRYLNVPFAEKAEAKAAGAKWDRQAKKWFAPEEMDPQIFQRWTGRAKASPSNEKRSPVEEFAVALKKHGLIFKGGPEMDGKWHRVPVDDDKAGQLSGSYRGFLDGRPSGQIMNYRSGEKAVQWVANGHQVDPAEIARLKVDAEPRKAQQSAELQEQYRKVAKRAYGIFVNAQPAPVDHPYLSRKGVPAGDLRVDADGNLLVPMKDEKNFLWNIQSIHPDGTKRYLKDGRKAGLMHVIEGTVKGQAVVAEGYATAADLRAASGRTVAVAFDAGNLEAVAGALKKRSPDTDLVIAADDDHKLEAQNKPNTGIVHAKQAAEAVGGRWIAPPLSPDEKAKGLTDYNDLAQERGRPALAQILTEQLGPAKAKPKRIGLARQAPAMTMTMTM